MGLEKQRIASRGAGSMAIRLVLYLVLIISWLIVTYHVSRNIHGAVDLHLSCREVDGGED